MKEFLRVIKIKLYLWWYIKPYRHKQSAYGIFNRICITDITGDAIRSKNYAAFNRANIKMFNKLFGFPVLVGILEWGDDHGDLGSSTVDAHGTPGIYVNSNFVPAGYESFKVKELDGTHFFPIYTEF